MEYLKITKVDNIILHRRGRSFKGSLHLTTHHLIFTLAESGKGPTDGKSASLRELWCCYPIIERVELRKGSALMYKRSWKGIDSGEQVAAKADGTNEQGGNDDGEKQTHNLALEAEVEAWKRDQLYKGANLKIYCRDYNYMSFDFQDVMLCKDVYDSVMKLTCTENIEDCYAFLYEPIVIESQYDSWWDYDPEGEFVREGLCFDKVKGVPKQSGGPGNSPEPFGKSDKGRNSWRMANVNETYDVCDTYPRWVCVPGDVQDAVIAESSKFRSRARFPCLAYYYRKNGCTITRCSQPLVGIKQNRSYQDERLIYGAFSSNGHAKAQNLIVDARPVTSAMAQMAVGAGTESMDNYWGDTSRKLYLGLENIHVIRDSMNSVKEVLRNGDVDGAANDMAQHVSALEITEHRARMHEQLVKSGWKHYVSQILKATDLLVKWIHLKGAHLVVHCSDGWDRTPQVISLVEICIDPYFRTLDGFFVLVEKDWCSFGHRFNDRCGRLNTEGKFHDYASSKVASVGTRFRNFQGFKGFRQLNQALRSRPNADTLESPTFQQFLDCVYQLMRQNPTAFQYNERFLRRLVYHLYSCQYGTFLQNCDKERYELDLPSRTRSVWDYFKARRAQFTNPDYVEPAKHLNTEMVDGNNDDDYDYDANVLYPNYTDVIFWYQLNGRSYEDMNGVERRAKQVGSFKNGPKSNEIGTKSEIDDENRKIENREDSKEEEEEEEKNAKKALNGKNTDGGNDNNAKRLEYEHSSEEMLNRKMESLEIE